MKTVYLLRHAKSSWADTALADHDRPLSPRGRRAALAMAGVLARTRPRPRIVLCSSAIRAQQTWEPIAMALGPSPVVRIDERLYGAPASDVLGLVRELPEDTRAVLVVAHNQACRTWQWSCLVRARSRISPGSTEVPDWGAAHP